MHIDLLSGRKKQFAFSEPLSNSTRLAINSRPRGITFQQFRLLIKRPKVACAPYSPVIYYSSWWKKSASARRKSHWPQFSLQATSLLRGFPSSREKPILLNGYANGLFQSVSLSTASEILSFIYALPTFPWHGGKSLLAKIWVKMVQFSFTSA